MDIVESTRGHYAVVGSLADGMKLADPLMRTEVRGLGPTTERPADILTAAALHGVQVALSTCAALRTMRRVSLTIATPSTVSTPTTGACETV